MHWPPLSPAHPQRCYGKARATVFALGFSPGGAAIVSQVPEIHTIRATPAPGCADPVVCTRPGKGISFPVNGTIVLRVGNFEAGKHQLFYGGNARPKCGFCARRSSNRTTSRAQRCLKFRPHCAGSNCDCSSTAPSPGPQRAQAAPPKRRSGKGSETRERLRLLASDVPLIKIAAFIETEAAEPGPCRLLFQTPKTEKSYGQFGRRFASGPYRPAPI